jgi:DNA-binding MarR family transcriptional regulator
MWNRFQSARVFPEAEAMSTATLAHNPFSPERPTAPPLGTFAPQTSALDRETSDGDARALHHALSDFVRVCQFRDRLRTGGHSLSVQQVSALDAVVDAGPSTLAAVAAHLLLDKSTTSRIVDGLERKGLIVRRRDPDDGRAIRITATETGRMLSHRIREGFILETRGLLESLTPESRRDAARLIGHLTRAVSAHLRVDQA